MTRQRFLWLALGLTLGGALTGCGSGGGDSRTTVTRGRLLVPGAAMQVVNGIGEGSVSAEGAFSLPTITASPSIAMALNSTGQLTGLGYVFPGRSAEQNLLGPASAALALFFLAVGGVEVMGNSKATLLDQLAAAPAFPPLAEAFQKRLAENPLALEQGDAALQEALVAAVERFKAGRAVPRPRTPEERTRGRQTATGFVLEPTTRQSGVEVLQDPVRDGAILPINHQRRECKVYAYRVGYEAENGVRQDLPKAEGLNLGDSLPATSALGGVWTTIGELITGNPALAPVTGTSVPLAQRAGEVKTYCEVVVIGSAFSQTEPEFFSAPRYADQVALWREARERLNLISWLRDLVFGLLLEALGVRDVLVNLRVYEAVATAWEGIDDAALRAVIGAAKRGELPRALTNLLRIALTDPEGLATLRKLQAASTMLAGYIAGEKAILSERLFQLGFRALSSLLLAVPGVVLGAIDLGLVIEDLQNARQADLWTATLLKPTVIVSPAAVSLSRGAEQRLTVRVPGAAPGTTLSYKWTLTGSDLATMNGEGRVGRTLETTGDSVVVATTPSTLGTLTVTVQAFQNGEDGTKTLVGEAKAALTMSDASNTKAVVIEKYDTGEAPTPAGTYQIMSGFLTFPLSPATDGVREYRIRVEYLPLPGADRDTTRTYTIQAASVGDPIPDDRPLDKNARKIPRSTSDGFGSFLFYRRGNQLYMNYWSTGYYPGTSEAEVEAAIRKKAEPLSVLFEAVR